AIAHTALADAARRLSSLYPSIDPSPHHSADTGCIRPPRSVWKRGGHQRLITDLKETSAAPTLRNPNAILGPLTSGTPAQPLPSRPRQRNPLTPPPLRGRQGRRRRRYLYP